MSTVALLPWPMMPAMPNASTSRRIQPGDGGVGQFHEPQIGAAGYGHGAGLDLCRRGLPMEQGLGDLLFPI